jgi:hypothetical protein
MSGGTPTISRLLALALVLTGAFLPAYAQAQDQTLDQFTPKGHGGLGLALVFPQGEFGDHIPAGIGLGAFAVKGYAGGVLGLRFDGLLAIYDWESRRVPRWQARQLANLDGCHYVDERPDVDMVNGSLSMFVGPQIAVPRGPIRPYANAGVGFSVIAMAAFVDCEPYYDDDESVTGYPIGDITPAWTGGVGIWIETSASSSLSLSVNYVGSGRARYLPESDYDVLGSSVVFSPVESGTSHFVVQVGMSFTVW